MICIINNYNMKKSILDTRKERRVDIFWYNHAVYTHCCRKLCRRRAFLSGCCSGQLPKLFFVLIFYNVKDPTEYMNISDNNGIRIWI